MMRTAMGSLALAVNVSLCGYLTAQVQTEIPAAIPRGQNLSRWNISRFTEDRWRVISKAISHIVVGNRTRRRCWVIARMRSYSLLRAKLRNHVNAVSQLGSTRAAAHLMASTAKFASLCSVAFGTEANGAAWLIAVDRAWGPGALASADYSGRGRVSKELDRSAHRIVPSSCLLLNFRP